MRQQTSRSVKTLDYKKASSVVSEVEGRPRAHLPVRPDWLALTDEPALHPSWPLVDAHHHLWQKDNPLHGREFSLSNLLLETSRGHRVVATVYVEGRAHYRSNGPIALAPVGETEFVTREVLANEGKACGVTTPCLGIVGHADLRVGANVDAVLESHINASDGRFRGIRQISAWRRDPVLGGTVHTPPEGLLRDSQFRQGFARLKRYKLSFDAWLYYTQLDDLIDLADAFPTTTIVIDHAGGIAGTGGNRFGREAFKKWQKGIFRAAQRPNIRVKLSGLGMRITGWALHTRRAPAGSAELVSLWRPYFEACIEAFSPSRCMFASNFPVDQSAVSYNVLWNAHKSIAAKFSDHERHAMLCACALHTYRLVDSRLPGDFNQAVDGRV